MGDGLASLESYRATFTLTATGSIQGAQEPAPLDAHLTTIDEKSQTSDAQRTVYVYTDTQRLEHQYTEQVRLGNSSFLILNHPEGKSCIAQPIRQSAQWELIPFSYSDLGELSESRYTGEEALALSTGSVRARHYVFERSVLGDFPSGQADVWIAAAGGYVARMRAWASGSGLFRSQPFTGRLEAAYELEQINRSISIEPPAICTGDAPIMPGAAQITIASNMTIYQVEASVAQVVEFYTREMRARGWTFLGEPAAEQGLTTLTFQRDTQTASILFSPSTHRPIIQVMIVITSVR